MTIAVDLGRKATKKKKQTSYGKCLKILNTSLFLFSNKMLDIRVRNHKMLVRIADQTASLLLH